MCHCSGTSFSAPYVAGVAARLQDAADAVIGRDLTQDEFVFVMQESGRDLLGYDGTAAGYKVADADLAVGYFLDAPSVTGQLICVDGGQHLGWQTPDVLGVE